MSTKYRELKEQCYEANLELPALGLVIYTFGNVSTADPALGAFAIKPSGVAYDHLHRSEMVVVDFEGKVIEGKLRPSSDTPTHAVLYRNFPKLGGIVHTHSPYAVAWAQACRSVPLYGTTHADHLACDIPCTAMLSEEQLKGNYEIETGNQIVRLFAELKLDPAEVPMVLAAGHGPFTWGKDAAKAVYHAKVLEELCRMALLTEKANPDARRLPEALIQKHYERKHGANAYYGQK